MILLLMCGEEPENHAARSFAQFRDAVHAQVPANHSIDLHGTTAARERGICGEHGRVVPTRQNLCPRCAGYLHDAEQIAVMRSMAKRLTAAR